MFFLVIYPFSIKCAFPLEVLLLMKLTNVRMAHFILKYAYAFNIHIYVICAVRYVVIHMSVSAR